MRATNGPLFTITSVKSLVIFVEVLFESSEQAS